jgi:hypothetical protein
MGIRYKKSWKRNRGIEKKKRFNLRGFYKRIRSFKKTRIIKLIKFGKIVRRIK